MLIVLSCNNNVQLLQSQFNNYKITEIIILLSFLLKNLCRYSDIFELLIIRSKLEIKKLVLYSTGMIMYNISNVDYVFSQQAKSRDRRQRR